jgi:hypothetical protein
MAGEIHDVSIADYVCLVECGRATGNAQRIADREQQLTAASIATIPAVEAAVIRPIVEAAVITSKRQTRVKRA